MTEYKAIYENLLQLGERERKDYLRTVFAGNTELLSGFLGWLKSELYTSKPSLAFALNLMNDVALVAISVGRRAGEEYAIRVYAPDFQFLLKEKEAV